MVAYGYKVIYFNKRDQSYYEKLFIAGLVSVDFDVFVKQAFYDKINKVRIEKLTEDLNGGFKHEDCAGKEKETDGD